MAWFAVMGVEQVAYHEATVLGLEDDHPGQALDYYGSRGETPLPGWWRRSPPGSTATTPPS